METLILIISVFAVHTTVVSSSILTDSEIYAFEVPVEIKDNLPYYLSSYDEEGAPNSGLNSTGKQFVVIGDMDGFIIRQAGDAKTVQFMISAFVRFEQIARRGTMKQMWILNANFLKRAWILNANILFESIWQIGSRIFGQLANYVEVHGTNEEKWKPKLLKQLPRDQIPEWYGGLPNHKPLKVFG